MLVLLGVPPWARIAVGLALIGVGLATQRTALAVIGGVVLVVGALGASGARRRRA